MTEPTTTFSFAKGNVEKLLALPRYAIGGVRTRLARRDPRLWAIGSNFGLADGALAFHEAARAADPGLQLVWLVGTKEQAEEAERRGIEWCPKHTRAGFDVTAAAGVVSVTHGFGDANRYALGGATIVQLWHGSPLKKLHADSPATLSLGPFGALPGARATVRELYRRGTSRISLLPVAADRFVPSMRSAFHLGEDRVLALGEPRTDLLFTGSVDERRARARARITAHLPDLGDRRVILYAPTWRDGEPDPSIPSAAQWRRLDDFCRAQDSVLLVRPHPLGVGSYTYRSAQVHLLDSSREPESMPLLWGVDVLVSDYSSMIFDFAVTGGPIVALAPDLEHYATTRGLYLNYTEVSGGRWYSDWDGVVDRLERLTGDAGAAGRAREHSLSLARSCHKHTDGGNAARVVARVQQLAGAAG